MLAVFREATTADLEYLVNHPTISEGCGVPKGSRVDMSGVATTHRAVGFISTLPGAVGGLVFGHLGDDVFDVHFMFMPGGSGKQMVRVGKAMLHEMFTNREARVIKGTPPRGNRAVRTIGVALGFTKIPDADFIDAQGRICDTYELRI